MVKAYLRYEPVGAFGVISSAANVVYDNCGRFLITPALESVLVWNVKQGSQVCGAGRDRKREASQSCVKVEMFARELPACCVPGGGHKATWRMRAPAVL
jgi:hypothetical protein